MPIPTKDGDASRRENVNARAGAHLWAYCRGRQGAKRRESGRFVYAAFMRVGTVRRFFEENPAREHCWESALANGRYLGNAALQKRVRPALGGEPAPAEPALGRG